MEALLSYLMEEFQLTYLTRGTTLLNDSIAMKLEFQLTYLTRGTTLGGLKESNRRRDFNSRTSQEVRPCILLETITIKIIFQLTYLTRGTTSKYPKIYNANKFQLTYLTRGTTD